MDPKKFEQWLNSLNRHSEENILRLIGMELRNGPRIYKGTASANILHGKTSYFLHRILIELTVSPITTNKDVIALGRKAVEFRRLFVNLMEGRHD